jgi:acetoacetyl-CoA synthetase
MYRDRRNPGGIRFGSSELYDVVGSCFVGSAEKTIVDCLAVGQKIDGGADERVILFVKLPEGQSLSLDLEQKIKSEIRTRRSPRHVPARVRIQYPITGNLFHIGHAIDHPG